MQLNFLTSASERGLWRELLRDYRRQALLAVTFLTRLPLPMREECSASDLRASLGWHPLVGAGLGLAGTLIYLILYRLMPPTVAAAVVIIALEIFTGALHFDGLMDTCDGMGSGKDRERTLEIMKDSRVGAMGVFGAVAVMLLKTASLAALAPGQGFIPLIAGWSAARAMSIIGVTYFANARQAGLGAAFAEGKAPWALGLGVGTALLVGFFTGGFGGLLLVIFVMASALGIQALIARKLGGLTGDVYGLSIEVAETLALLAWCTVVA